MASHRYGVRPIALVSLISPWSQTITPIIQCPHTTARMLTARRKST